MGVGAVAQPLCDRKIPDLPEQGHLKLRSKATLPGASSAAPYFLLPTVYLHNQRPWWPDDVGLIPAPYLPSWVNKVAMIKKNVIHCVRVHSTALSTLSLISLFTATLGTMTVPNYRRGN